MQVARRFTRESIGIYSVRLTTCIFRAGDNAIYSPYADARSWANALDWLEDVFEPKDIDVLPKDETVWQYGLTSESLVGRDVEYACGDATCRGFLAYTIGVISLSVGMP